MREAKIHPEFRSGYRLVKKGIDMAGSAALLCLLAPVFAAVSIRIKTEDPGPVIYVHERRGLGGKMIKVYKFRSMKTGSDDLESSLNDKDLEEYYQEYKLKNDPRVTRIGYRLRKTSLDELPQLINVLQGTMSLVGPRPIMEEEFKYYTPEEKTKLLSVKPGITGYWQVYGRESATYASGRRQQMELYYAENATLLLDAIILLKTIPEVIRKSRA